MKITAKLIRSFSKKLKAKIFANAVQRGWWDYFDRCEWIPRLHKYKYYCAEESKVYYVSQRAFAENFDNYVGDLEDQKEMVRDYVSQGGTL